ncbi:MAG: hypothetical protein KIH67_002065 [Candidatus Moranbacteria bacterium]|nr:hypothetical protein [Candidatus Moranbacteria bacterium]
MKYKLIVYVPESHADTVREAMGSAGAGKLGNYSYCSFSSRGEGRFLPLPGAEPHIGSLGIREVVEEERIEVTVDEEVLQVVITAMKSVHPYDEVAYDVYKLENF